MESFNELIEDVADATVSLIPTLLVPMEICHAVLTAKAVKKHWSRQRSFQFPLFCLLSTLGATFGGSIMVNFFTFRKPLLSGLMAARPVLISVAAWWLVFFCPSNMFEKICSHWVVLLPMALLKELFRTKKVWMAAEVGFAVYDGHLALATFIGSLGAVGGGFLMNLALLLAQKPADILADLKPSILTKLGTLFAALYVLEMAKFPMIPERNVIALLQFATVAPIVIAGKFGKTIDPFTNIENIFTAIFIELGRAESKGNKQKAD